MVGSHKRMADLRAELTESMKLILDAEAEPMLDIYLKAKEKLSELTFLVFSNAEVIPHGEEGNPPLTDDENLFMNWVNDLFLIGNTNKVQLASEKVLDDLTKKPRLIKTIIRFPQRAHNILSLIELKDSVIEENAIKIFRLLSAEEFQFRKEVLKNEKNVTLLLESLGFEKDVVKFNACSSIIQLCKFPPNMITIGIGGIEALLRIVEEKREKKDIKVQAISALSALCVLSQNRQLAIASGVIPTILNHLMKFEVTSAKLYLISQITERDEAVDLLVGYIKGDKEGPIIKEVSVRILYRIHTRPFPHFHHATFRFLASLGSDGAIKRLASNGTFGAKEAAKKLIESFKEYSEI